MNRICWMIVFYLVMGTSILNAQTLIPEQNGKGKWGYVDLDGKKVIDYKFKEAYPFIDGKAKVKKGEKWGYIDARGKEVIKIKYSEMYEWNGDYCKIAEGGSVKDGILTGAKWGYINRRGDIIMKAEYDEIGLFKDGLAYVMKGGKYGYIDDSFHVFIPCKYTAVGTFNERGYCWVNEGGKFDKKKNKDIVKGGKFGVYKRNGDLIVPVKYKAIGTFDELTPDANPLMASIYNDPEYIKQLRKIKKDGYALMRYTPNLFKFSFDVSSEFDFSETKKYVESHTKELNESYLEKMSEADRKLAEECGSFELLTYSFLSPKKFGKLSMTKNTYIVVSNKFGFSSLNGEMHKYDYRKSNEKFFHKIGIFDGNGTMLLPPDKYDLAYSPNNGFITVAREKKKKVQSNYYTIESGKLLFKDWIDVEVVTPFEKGNAVIATHKEQYLIDKEGRKISKNYSLILPMRESVYVVKNGDKCGIIDSLGHEIISPSYNLISPVSEGLMCAQKDKGGLYGFLDKKGEFVIPAMYESAQSFKYGWASVRTKSGWGEIEPDNKMAVECKWNNTAAKEEWKPKLMWVQKENKGLWYCLSTETNQLAFSAGYTGFRNFNRDFEGVAVVWDKNNKVGCISSDGKVLVPCIMPNRNLAIKAYSQMLNQKMGAWTEIDTYKFMIRNNQERNKCELTGTIENDMWDY